MWRAHISALNPFWLASCFDLNAVDGYSSFTVDKKNTALNPFPERDAALVDDLRDRSAETEWLEFKHNNADPQMIGKAVSALSNSARAAGRECGYLCWGIEDGSHSVLGTDFDPNGPAKGSQPLPIWLTSKLKPNVRCEFRTVDHPAGRV
ncbi:MAG: ATP-binding protein, partial [Pseudomonadota bacterium]